MKKWLGRFIGTGQEIVGLSGIKGCMTMSRKECLQMTSSNVCGTSVYEQNMKFGPGDELLTRETRTVACENGCFSSLFAAQDVSRGITTETQRQKFHTDDVKSVRNPVRSANWSTE